MTLAEWSAIIFGLVGAVPVVIAGIVYISKKLRGISQFTDPRLVHFLDDWFGEEARPGVAGRDGVMQRLKNLEEAGAELYPNGGNSLADTVNRIERRVKRMDEREDGR